MRVSTREPDEAWVPSEQLSGAGEAGSGAVGVDPQGRITAVWDEAGKVMWADKAPGQPWTEAQAIPDGDGGKPDLFVASDGTATAVWQKGTTADTLVIRTARRPLGGPWSAVETISPGGSYRPHIEGDTAGDVTVSYTHEARREPALHLRGRPPQQRTVGRADPGRRPGDHRQHLRPRGRAQQRPGDGLLAERIDKRADGRAGARRRARPGAPARRPRSPATPPGAWTCRSATAPPSTAWAS